VNNNKIFRATRAGGIFQFVLSTAKIFLLFCLTFLLLTPALGLAREIPCEWESVERIVAVGDLHGDYDNFKILLKGTGLVSSELHWTGGRAHLVQLGDILDRGPAARKIFDLLKQLEKEAPQSGGKVHVLIGNHEESNITGLSFDFPGYVTLEEFLSFLPKDYRKREESKFLKTHPDRSPPDGASYLPLRKDVRDYWENIMKSKSSQKLYYKNFNKLYGNWILKHNAIIKINNIVFIHGGVSERLSTWDLSKLNTTVRKELIKIRSVQVYNRPYDGIPFKIAFRADGLYWYRGLALNSEDSFQPNVDRILSNLKADHMVIGHTTLKTNAESLEDISRFKGKILTIDTGISAFYGSRIAALIIQNGEFFLWRAPHDS